MVRERGGTKTYLRALVFLLLRLSLLTLFFLHLALIIQDLMMVKNQEYGDGERGRRRAGGIQNYIEIIVSSAKNICGCQGLP